MTDKFDEIWKKASREAAVEFLRRVVRPDTTLAALKGALEFEGVAAHLATVSLQEVLAPSQAGRPTPSRQEGTPHAPRRRGRPQGKASKTIDPMKRLVLQMFAQAPKDLASGRVGEWLTDNGYTTTPMRTYMLLKSLQKSGWVVGEGNHRKAWNITEDGRKALLSEG